AGAVSAPGPPGASRAVLEARPLAEALHRPCRAARARPALGHLGQKRAPGERGSHGTIFPFRICVLQPWTHVRALTASGARVSERPGMGPPPTRLEQRLQPRADHRPAAEQFVVGALAQLVVGDRQPARVLDLLDLPRDARCPFAPDVLAPQRPEALHEP